MTEREPKRQPKHKADTRSLRTFGSEDLSSEGVLAVIRQSEALAPNHDTLPQTFQWESLLAASGAREALLKLDHTPLRKADWQYAGARAGSHSRKRQIKVKEETPRSLIVYAAPMIDRAKRDWTIPKVAAVRVELSQDQEGVTVAATPSEHEVVPHGPGMRTLLSVCLGIFLISAAAVLLTGGSIPLIHFVLIAISFAPSMAYFARRRASLRWRPTEQLELLDHIQRALPKRSEEPPQPYRRD